MVTNMLENINPVETTALVVVVVAFLRFIEALITKFLNRDKEQAEAERQGKIKDELGKIATICKEMQVWQHQRDSDGIPLGYMPRSVIQTQKEVAKSLTELVQLHKAEQENTKRMLELYERLYKKIDEHYEEI